LRETDLLLETASSSMTNLAFPSTAGPSSGSMADLEVERLLENVSHSMTNLTFPPMLVLLRVAWEDSTFKTAHSILLSFTIQTQP
jgi:hypothetical protein